MKKLNHFDPTDKRTWSQRYWIIDQFYDHDKGPVILYICGEARCYGADGFPVYLAQQLNAAVFTLEHRFYGASQPFGNESMQIQNIKYLTIQNALEDLAYFINWANNTNLAGINQNTPWVTIGGSYPGALSAWFRSKYPYLTVGALASSGVVHPILNFYQYDEQIRTSVLKSGEWCADGVRSLNLYVQDQLSNQTFNQYIKLALNGTQLSDGMFMFIFADIFAGLVQYGQREMLCNDFIQNKTNEQALQAIINYAQNSSSVTYLEGYQLENLSNTTYDINGDLRQWFYQKCTEVGWYQTAPSNNQSLRSYYVNVSAYEQLCSVSYAEGYKPNVNNTNVQFGGTQIMTDNLIMTNGGEDPWQWASIRESQGGIIAYVINCTDCGHCRDLYYPQPNDPPQVKYAQNLTLSHFTQWVNQHWQQIEAVQLVEE